MPKFTVTTEEIETLGLAGEYSDYVFTQLIKDADLNIKGFAGKKGDEWAPASKLIHSNTKRDKLKDNLWKLCKENQDNKSREKLLQTYAKDTIVPDIFDSVNNGYNTSSNQKKMIAAIAKSFDTFIAMKLKTDPQLKTDVEKMRAQAKIDADADQLLNRIQKSPDSNVKGAYQKASTYFSDSGDYGDTTFETYLHGKIKEYTSSNKSLDKDNDRLTFLKSIKMEMMVYHNLAFIQGVATAAKLPDIDQAQLQELIACFETAAKLPKHELEGKVEFTDLDYEACETFLKSVTNAEGTGYITQAEYIAKLMKTNIRSAKDTLEETLKKSTDESELSQDLDAAVGGKAAEAVEAAVPPAIKSFEYTQIEYLNKIISKNGLPAITKGDYTELYACLELAISSEPAELQGLGLEGLAGKGTSFNALDNDLCLKFLQTVQQGDGYMSVDDFTPMLDNTYEEAELARRPKGTGMS